MELTRNQRYYLKNKDKIAENYKNKYAAKSAIRYQEQKAAKLEYQRNYAKENKEDVVQYQAAYYKTKVLTNTKVNKRSCGIHSQVIAVSEQGPVMEQLQAEKQILISVVEFQHGNFIISFD